MRLLFVCNTLYQIIVASSIRKMFPDAKADIILSDHSMANQSVCKKINESKLVFDRAFYVETKYLYEYDKSITRIQKNKILRECNTILSMVNIDSKYDAFFCANAEPFTDRVANYVKKMNKRATLNWFEDGLSAYSFDRCYFPSNYRMLKSKIKRACFGVYNLTAFIDNFYVFKPDKLEWKPKAAIKGITPIDKNLAEELGTIFSYSECRDSYAERFIFFEDGMQDWEKGSDIILLNKIANKIGKENIIVRTHPRDTSNRFQSAGFKTNRESSIPWEIIAINMDLTGKVLMTMYSQSVIMPDILMGTKETVVSLGELDPNFDSKNHELYSYMKRAYFDKDTLHYKIPHDMHEFERIIDLL